MSRNRKLLAAVATILALGAAAGGIAYAVGGGESEEQVTGPDAKKAQRAALDAAGGGTVLEAEYQEAGSAGFYEVEVQRPDGSQVEVHVDGNFEPVGTAADDDSGTESEDEGTEGADDD